MATNEMRTIVAEGIGLEEAVDGIDRALLVPYARAVLVLPPANGDVARVIIEWAEDGPVELAAPGSAVWRAAIHMRLNQLRRAYTLEPELAVFERSALQTSLDRFPTLRDWWSWLRTGWLASWR